jgi:hypothetical protein
VLQACLVESAQRPVDAGGPFVEAVVAGGRARVVPGLLQCRDDLRRALEERVAGVRRTDRCLEVTDREVRALDERFDAAEQGREVPLAALAVLACGGPEALVEQYVTGCGQADLLRTGGRLSTCA